MMQNKTEILIEWVKEQHKDQKQKYTEIPYQTHLQNVANIVSTHIKDNNVIEIAWCHELYKYTTINHITLFNKLISIGYNHAEASFITSRVNDITSLYTSEPNIKKIKNLIQFLKYGNIDLLKKMMEAKRISNINPITQSVKYADIIDNSNNIPTNIPNLTHIYIQKTKNLIRLLRKGNVNLLIEACYSIKQAQIKLDNQKNTQTKGA